MKKKKSASNFRAPFALLAINAILLASSSTSSATTSSDDASLYSDFGPTGWMSNAHQGGRALGRWALSANLNGGFAGSFLGDSSIASADVNVGGKSFALYANPPATPASPSSTATRSFARPSLTTGDTLSLSLSVNYRNGAKGFSLRDSSGVSRFNFTVGRVDGTNGGYYIRNGASPIGFDNGQTFGPYSADTEFVFSFTQAAGKVEWSATRYGGVPGSASGEFQAPSGTIADLHFFVTGTESGTTSEARAANNLYFNNIALTLGSLGDAPLTPGERRLPGLTPSYIMKYEHSSPATAVSLRHSGNSFASSVPMVLVGGFWELDIRTLGLSPGWHEFKFLPDGQWETGENRRMYLDKEGRLSKPPAVYLTWKGDPTTTMTVQWHNYSYAASSIWWRPAGSGNEWTPSLASSEEFPYSERWVHSAELTGLESDSEYEFSVEGYDEVFKFRTMPAALTRPLKFAVGGDVGIGSTADLMTSAIASHSPDFIVVGGDLAYADGRAANFWKWYRFFESWHHRARTPDGRLIPQLVAIGNHEVYSGFVQNHPDFTPTPSWRARNAPYFYSCFSFPGQPGYGVVDFGQYLSLVILDSDHTNRIADQVGWLDSVLASRRGRPHLIPIYHTPAYTSNRSFSTEQATAIRQHWIPLFESAGVRLAFEHHDHTFKVTKPILAGAENENGIVFVGDGLWGVAPRPPDLSRWYLGSASEQHHVHLVTISPSGRTVQSVGLDGQFFGALSADGVIVSQLTDEAPQSVVPAISNMGKNFITLQWDLSPRASSYRVVRSDGQEFEASGTEFTDLEWTPQAGYTYEVMASNRAGITPPSGSLAPSGKQVWAVSHELSWDGSGDGSMSADPDGDGWINLAEYFHGTDPVSPSREPVWVPSGSSESFEVRFRKSSGAQGVRASVLWSESLEPSAQWNSSGVIQRWIGVDSSDQSVSWYGVSVPSASPPPKLFLKMRIEDLEPDQ